MLIWNNKITKIWLVIYTEARENRKTGARVPGKGDSEINTTSTNSRIFMCHWKIKPTCYPASETHQASVPENDLSYEADPIQEFHSERICCLKENPLPPHCGLGWTPKSLYRNSGILHL